MNSSRRGSQNKKEVEKMNVKSYVESQKSAIIN